MTTVLWRLHRRQLTFAAGCLVALTVALVVTGLHMHGTYHDALSSCGATHTCSDLADQVFQGDGFILDLVLATMAIPLLFGMFWGAPMVAREIEEGTQSLIWTQGVTRRRWLGTNLAWTLLVAAAWGAALSLLVSWWSAPENVLDGRLGPGTFDVQGLMPIASSIFAVALGVAAGTWFRRVLPALATTVGVFVVVRVTLLEWVRPHYLAPIRRVLPLLNNRFGAPAGSWIVSRDVLDPLGHVITKEGSAYQPCTNAVTVSMSCLNRLGFRRLVVFQPASRFWTFQAIEAGILVVLAALMLASATWRISSTDA